MKHILVLIMSSFTLTSFTQQKISLNDVKNHINDSVEITSKVSEISYLPNAKNSPTIIYVGGKSPKQLLSVVIFGDIRNKLGYNPQEEKYLQGVVIARGKLELVNRKPQIVIKDPKQLAFIYDEEVPLPPPPIKENKN